MAVIVSLHHVPMPARRLQFVGLPSRVLEEIWKRKLWLLERISQIEGKRRRKGLF